MHLPIVESDMLTCSLLSASLSALATLVGRRLAMGNNRRLNIPHDDDGSLMVHIGGPNEAKTNLPCLRPR